MELLKSIPEGTLGATWPTFYKPGAFVLLLYVTAIGTNLNWIFDKFHDKKAEFFQPIIFILP